MGVSSAEIVLTSRWFTLSGDFLLTIQALDVGEHRLTVLAKGSEMKDAISRRIRIIPDGKEIEVIDNGWLEKKISRTIAIPEDVDE